MLGLTKLLIRPNGPDSDGFLAVTDDGGQSWTIPDEDELMRATGESAAYWMKELRLVAETFALGMGYMPTTPEIVGVRDYPARRSLRSHSLER